MHLPVVLIWLATWLGLSVLLILALVAVGVVREHRRLSAMQFPGPLLLIARRAHGALTGARGEARHDLAGRTAWLNWDFRWGPSGQTLAVVTGQSDLGALELELGSPIEVPPIGKIVRVRFVPRSAARAAYDRAAVRGRLEPTLEGCEPAIAEIVVYPSKRRSR